MSGRGMDDRDISKELENLRRRLAALGAMDGRVASVISSMGDGISVQSPDFRVLYQNQAHREIVGGDKTGKHCFEAYGGNSSVCEGCALDRAFKDGKVHRHERSINSGFRTVHYEVVASTVKDPSGKIVAGIEMVRDISDTKKASRDLEFRNLLLETQMETALDGILVVDENGKWLSFNRRFVEMWGMPEEIVTSRSDEEAIQFVLDKVVDPDAFVVQVHQIYESSDTRNASEVRLLDGRTFERFTAPVNSPAGEYMGRVWYFRDVSMRTKAEEQLRQYREHLEEIVRERTSELTAAVNLLEDQIEDRRRSEKFITNILESIDEYLLVLGPDYRMISANKSFCDHMGMSAEELKGKLCHEILHGKDVPCWEEGEDCSVRRAFSTGHPATSAHLHRRNGDTYNVETKTYPMRDDDGNVTSVIQIIHDVTEKRRLEEQLRHSQKMEAIGQLAGGVAHDFNNRLAAIMNYAFILKTKMSPDEPLRVHVNQIVNSAERAAHLTQNLLTFSRKHVINPRPVRLNDVVEGVEKLLVRLMGADIKLKTEYAKEELVVMADSGQMEHVLINLATNARDAMPGAGSVAIGTSRTLLGRDFFEGRSTSRPGQYAVVSFIDTGAGMNAETRAKIFDPFFTTKDIGKGTGLGLSIAYGIIKQHGGYVNVESEPGLGTAFYIFLPLLPARAEHAEAEKVISPAGGSETVLVVEDDEDVRTPVKQMLEGFGYRVVEAVNGEEAVEKFLQSRKKIKLLVLDVILPGMNGVEVLGEIRKVEPGIAAIFTSGYSQEHVRKRGLLEPGAAFLSKPVSPPVLLAKIREALDR